jgi:hypothetical protein
MEVTRGEIAVNNEPLAFGAAPLQLVLGFAIVREYGSVIMITYFTNG